MSLRTPSLFAESLTSSKTCHPHVTTFHTFYEPLPRLHSDACIQTRSSWNGLYFCGCSAFGSTPSRRDSKPYTCGRCVDISRFAVCANEIDRMRLSLDHSPSELASRGDHVSFLRAEVIRSQLVFPRTEGECMHSNRQRITRSG